MDQASSPPQPHLRSRRASSERWRSLTAAIAATVCAALLHTALFPALASAQDARVQELVTRARTARDNGRYDEAIRLLLEAYDLRPDPALLFNVAKVYEAQSDCQNVLRYFLRAAEANATGTIERPEVDKAVRSELRSFACANDRPLTIQLLEQAFTNFPEPAILLNLGDNYRTLGECEKAEHAYKETVARTPPRGPLHNDAQIALAELDCQPIDPEPIVPPEAPVNWLAWSLVGVGAAALTGGLVLETIWLLDFTTYNDKLDASRSPAISEEDRSRLEAEAAEIFSGIEEGRKISVPLLVIGTLAAGTGLTFWLLGVGQPDAATVSLSPVLSPGSAGLSLTLPLP